jgi:hypothetical protein
MSTLIPAKKPTDMQPGEYAATFTTIRPKVRICCPECGGEFELARHYLVAAGGIVNPAIHCPLYGCTWKRVVTFAGWNNAQTTSKTNTAHEIQ